MKENVRVRIFETHESPSDPFLLFFRRKAYLNDWLLDVTATSQLLEKFEAGKGI